MDSAVVQKTVKYLGVFLIILTVFVGVEAVNAIKQNKYIGGGVPSGNVISVEGSGEVQALPDVAEVTFSVYSSEVTVADAQSKSAEKANAIIAYLKSQGIVEKDIKTTGYNANPKYEWRASGATSVGAPTYYPQPGNQVIVGYEVTQTISVKVRDTENVGAILSGLGEKGATNIYGPTFTIDDETQLKQEARQKAIEDAKQKAKELANELDVRLVRIIGFYEQSGPMPYYGYGMGGDAMAVKEMAVPVVPDVPVGENTITANVSITYEIR